jgi:drug/metabolite transporter (DMT)-like permease
MAGLYDPRPVLLALGTGCFIAAYTVIDAFGARSAGTPHGYMVWLSLLWAIPMSAAVHVLQRGRRIPVSERSQRVGVLAGLMSYGSSWLVIWALTLAPMALVSALRETSIVFAVIIGVVFLHERLSLMRLASIATTLIGTAVLKMNK